MNDLMSLLGTANNTDQNALLGGGGSDLDIEKLRQLLMLQQLMQAQKAPQVQMSGLNAQQYPALQLAQRQQQQNPLMALMMHNQLTSSAGAA